MNTAARVAGSAAGDEIVASADTLGEAGDIAASEPREVALKGDLVGGQDRHDQLVMIDFDRAA